MTKIIQDLPTRFMLKENQPKDFWLSRSGRHIKSTDFRKVYNKIVNPFLRKKGFKVSGFKALNEDDNFFYMVFWASNKFGGNGCMNIHVHPKGFPKKGEFKWDTSSYKESYHYLFKKPICLPNKNEWIDIGINNDEAQETCEYLLDNLKKEYQNYIIQFTNFPTTLLEINATNFNEKYLNIYRTFGLSFHGETKYDAAIWLAKIHSFYHSSEALQLAEIARQEMIDGCKNKGYDVHRGFNEYIDNLKKGILTK